MAMPLAQRQADYRARKNVAFARQTAALECIARLVEGKTGPVAVEVSKIAKEALAPPSCTIIESQSKWPN